MVSVFDGAEDVAPERLIRLEPKVTALEDGDRTVFTADGAVICTEKPESEPEKTWDPGKVQPKPLRYQRCVLHAPVPDRREHAQR